MIEVAYPSKDTGERGFVAQRCSQRATGGSLGPGVGYRWAQVAPTAAADASAGREPRTYAREFNH